MRKMLLAVVGSAILLSLPLAASAQLAERSGLGGPEVARDPAAPRTPGGANHSASQLVPTYDHIVVVMMENQNYSAIIGKAKAPYINGLASTGALLTNYLAVAHPSEPNYLILETAVAEVVTGKLSIIRCFGGRF